MTDVLNTCGDCNRTFRWPTNRGNCPRCDASGDGVDRDTYATRHGPAFQDIRKKVLERDDHRCQGCGLTDSEHRERDDLFGGGLHVHHIEPVNTFEDPDDAHRLANLVSLCANCHQQSEHT